MALRIIAGEFRRRKLQTNTGQKTRPITDRMKETLFERLGDVEDTRVADVFAGTGTLGLECLSRGAANAVFFEFDRKAFNLLLANVEHTGAGSRAFCWRVDVKRTSFRPKGLDGALPYSLVFFDPPYPMIDQLNPGQPLGNSLKRLARPDITADEAIMVLRTPNEKPLPELGSWQEFEGLRIGSSRISLCQKMDSLREQQDDPEATATT